MCVCVCVSTLVSTCGMTDEDWEGGTVSSRELGVETREQVESVGPGVRPV
jgi:hypothetical protein